MRRPEDGYYVLIFVAVVVLAEHLVRHMNPWSYITPIGLIILAILMIRACHHNEEHTDRLKSFRCLNCGYPLTGNTSGTCPECGRVIDHPRYKRPR